MFLLSSLHTCVVPPQEIAFFDVTRTGELLSRLSEDTQIIKNAATTNLSEALRNLTTTAIGLGFMFSTSWKLTRKYQLHVLGLYSAYNSSISHLPFLHSVVTCNCSGDIGCRA